MEVEGPKRLSISAKGPGVVTAGDISESNGIEVLNKDHVICHLDDGADVFMELTVNTGKGYVSADKNRPKMRRSA
jgi:DNA-directed RNA polymerase subunit alpha